MSEPIINIVDLKKYFAIGDGLFERKKKFIKAIEDFTFNINEGEIVGLIGESGSGKTTLARILLGLTKAMSGSAVIDGIDMTAATRAEKKLVRSKISVVFQDPAANLNPRQTVESSIMRPMLINGVPKNEAKERAREALEKVKMDADYLSSYPHQLSGGQQQRIAIARALVLKPKIMILDEPTSALDISIQAQVLNLLLDLQEELKLTYLVVTHDLNVIRYISDRIAVMCLGRLVEYGDTEDVIKTPSHPYTKILMSSVPIMDPTLRSDKRKIYEGEAGSLIDVGDGCRLFSRCEYRSERCRTECPQLKKISNGHYAACFYSGNINKEE